MIAGSTFGSSGAFGQPASQPAAGTTNIFGQPQQPQQQPATGGTFGGFGISQCYVLRPSLTLLLEGSNTAAKPIFGQPAQSTNQPSTGFGMFGNQQPQQPQPQQPQTGNVFGNPGGSMFGQPQQQQQPQQTGRRLYFLYGRTNSLMTNFMNSIWYQHNPTSR